MTPDDLYGQVVSEFRKRKFATGLVIAFMDLLSHLGVPGKGLSSFEKVLKRHRRREVLPGGGHANTLVVEQTPGGKTISLRPFYNDIERFFRSEQKRFDYPSCAPHATQCWQDYTHWLDALVGYSPAQVADLRAKVIAYVLAQLESQAFDPSTQQKELPIFRRVLEAFELPAQKGEPTGAAYQGLVFGFLRADNPHLQVEIDKVRTGSKRLQRVADVDGWDGARLAISAEVKQFRVKLDDVTDLHDFANAVRQRGAIGMVVALGFEAGAREAIEALGTRALDTDDLLEAVSLWDPLKQRTAVQSMVYYVKHVEKNAALAKRLDAFLAQETSSKASTQA
ncbi:MAG TPA: hypothetical protein VEL76_25940 [Gemmataceae bacterium]|nr:hypothetical protein [Gemmataceae bacterium]